MTTRTVFDDAAAIAAMPNLEMAAKVLEPFCRRVDPLAVLWYAALAWSARSNNDLTAMLKTNAGDLWSHAVTAASQVGRDLGDRPPTFNAYRHVRDRATAAAESGELHVADRLAALLPAMAEPIVAQCGLLTEDNKPRWHHPDRRNTIYGDGSIILPLSSVAPDPETGECSTSRSKYGNPRVAHDVVTTKKGRKIVTGRLVVVLGAHSGTAGSRVILGLDAPPGKNEYKASVNLFKTVMQQYGGRVHAVNYDQLWTGHTIAMAMEHGVVPIVEMRNARRNQMHGPLTDPTMQRLIGTSSNPMERMPLYEVDVVSHDIGQHRCTHQIWALAGTLVTTPAGSGRPSLDSQIVEQTALRHEPFEPGDRPTFVGYYRLRCPHGTLPYRLNFGGILHQPTREVMMAQAVRAISVADDQKLLTGRRSDAESVFSTVQRALPVEKRASALSREDFFMDLIGWALLTNAQAWDRHGGRDPIAYRKVVRQRQAKTYRPPRAA